jgi:RimJ/RimL family protein N-acetyltransferase
MKNAPQLTTDRLSLEPVRADHAQEIWPQLDDERMWRYFPELRPATPDALRRQYEKWERGSPNTGEIWLNWLCRERSHRALVAAMQATVFVRMRVAYLAYAVYPLHQRKGYAREAALAVIAYVRDTYGVERFRAEMDARNEPSYRLAESLGFTRIEAGAEQYVYELAV